MNDEQIAALTDELIDHVAELVVLLDQLGSIRFINKRTEQILRMPAADWIGRPVFDVLHPDDLALGLELMVSARASGPGVKEPVTYRLRTGDGSWALVEVIASTIALPDGELAMIVCGREISQRRASTEILGEAAERLSRMFEDAPIGMAQTGLDGRFLRLNRSFADMLGRDVEELVGRSFTEFLHPDDVLEGHRAFAQLVAGTLPRYRRSARYVDAAGRVVHAELTATLVRDRHGIALYCAAQAIDVTPLREAQAELLHRSTHDPLTGLANRELLLTLLSQALSRAARRGGSIAVLFLDLDGFKAVNDSYGHAVGNDLLVEVARRLSAIVRHGDVASRLGGDEFMVMCEDAEPGGVREIASRLIAALAEPFIVGEASVRIGVSVGMAIEPADTVGADDLILHADTALYQAKRRGRGQISQYEIPSKTPPPG